MVHSNGYCNHGKKIVAVTNIEKCFLSKNVGRGPIIWSNHLKFIVYMLQKNIKHYIIML